MEEINDTKSEVAESTAKTSASTVEGTVKSFDAGRKFGFISSDGGKEVFVHQEAILDQAKIAPGDRVSFELAESPKGPRAASVRKL